MYFRARDEERASTIRTQVRTAQQIERLALARELHDVIAHHVTGIVVQAQAAQVSGEPQTVTSSLDHIVSSGTEALVAMRRLVATMRGTESIGSAANTTTDFEADLAALVAQAGRDLPETCGAHVELRIALDRHQIPGEIARSALRIVQESLTNTRKHALHATRADVSVTSSPDAVHVRVTDDGSARQTHPPGGFGGYGLIGMRERIELLGGQLLAGPRLHRGWQVEASLPLGQYEQGQHP